MVRVIWDLEDDPDGNFQHLAEHDTDAGEKRGLQEIRERFQQERPGLSLSDVAVRSGMDRAAVSRLEDGACLNPTLETLYRYAEAVRAEIGFTIHTS